MDDAVAKLDVMIARAEVVLDTLREARRSIAQGKPAMIQPAAAPTVTNSIRHRRQPGRGPYVPADSDRILIAGDIAEHGPAPAYKLGARLRMAPRTLERTIAGCKWFEKDADGPNIGLTPEGFAAVRGEKVASNGHTDEED